MKRREDMKQWSPEERKIQESCDSLLRLTQVAPENDCAKAALGALALAKERLHDFIDSLYMDVDCSLYDKNTLPRFVTVRLHVGESLPKVIIYGSDCYVSDEGTPRHYYLKSHTFLDENNKVPAPKEVTPQAVAESFQGLRKEPAFRDVLEQYLLSSEERAKFLQDAQKQRSNPAHPPEYIPVKEEDLPHSVVRKTLVVDLHDGDSGANYDQFEVNVPQDAVYPVPNLIICKGVYYVRASNDLARAAQENIGERPFCFIKAKYINL